MGSQERHHELLRKELVSFADPYRTEQDYRYNPFYNDLDAYALAYNVASLLNNLSGNGKEPFRQQAYTNLVKFLIQLHTGPTDCPRPASMVVSVPQGQVHLGAP